MRYCGDAYVEYIPQILKYDIQSDLNPNPVIQNQPLDIKITIVSIQRTLTRQVYYCGDIVVGREV